VDLIRAAAFELTEEDLDQIARGLSGIKITGERQPEAALKATGR
jgi:hypothetical protein